MQAGITKGLSKVAGPANSIGIPNTRLEGLMFNYSKITNSLEVPDPYYGGENGFENVLDLLEDACSSLLEDLNLME